MNDGQGVDIYAQGLPLIEAANAQPSTDASAMIALATPTAVSGGPMIDLEYQPLPGAAASDSDAGASNNSLGNQIIVGVIVAVLTAWIVR